MARLQRILFYRELGFDLATIGAVLADPTATDEDRLREQRRLLTDRIDRQRAMVVNARNPLLWNLMYPVLGEPDGSFYFDNQPNLLDQFLVNRNMAKQNSPIKADPNTVAILRFPGTASTGRYRSPIPFGGMGKKVDKEGFSDHFPIGTIVTIN